MRRPRSAARAAWRTRLWTYRLPVALIHAGLVIALVAGTAATVFDSYAQRMVAYPEDFGSPIRFPDGFALSVTLEEDGIHADGGRGRASARSAGSPGSSSVRARSSKPRTATPSIATSARRSPASTVRSG